MSMKLMEVFERIGLVEISREGSALTETDVTTMPATETGSPLIEGGDFGRLDAQGSAVARGDSAAGYVTVEENRAFDDIYAAAGIAESPFSADKLLKLLDALGGLPEETRKQAVIAMDAAEESWTIEDPVLDAQRRIQALEEERRRLGDQADRAEAQGAVELQTQKEYEQQAIAQIRQQIADLEALMERELKRVAETCERIKAQSQSTREACQREQARLDKEISRLQHIEKMFMVAAAETHSHDNQQAGA